MHYRVENFKSLKNTGDIEIAPLTIFIGPNGTGKSSALEPLLFLSQTMTNSRDEIGFLPNGEYINLGNYEDFIIKHDVNQKLRILLDFDPKCKNCTKKCLYMKENKKIEETNTGDIPPAKYEIIFLCGKDNQPELEEIKIFDCLGRLLLSRKKGKSGRYNIKLYEKLNDEDKKVYEKIINQKPNNFIFDEYEIFNSVISKIAGIKKNSKIEIEKSISSYLNVISYNKNQVLGNLRKIKYIGPIREGAERIYPYNKENIDDVGCSGKNTASILYENEKTHEKNRELKKWLEKFKFAVDFKTDPVVNHPELFLLKFKESGKDYFINYADSCFGLSQLLPILVQAIYSQGDDITIIEQPELHLNPCLESTLADFFTEMVKNGSKKKFMIETHSEYFLLRLRTYIKTGKLAHDKVNIYFTENVEGESLIRKIDIDKDGNFPNNDWPVGFFEESLAENMMFATATKQ
jgi:predicted ATPase